MLTCNDIAKYFLAQSDEEVGDCVCNGRSRRRRGSISSNLLRNLYFTFIARFLLGGIFAFSSAGIKEIVGSNTGGHGPLEVMVIINSLAEL